MSRFSLLLFIIVVVPKLLFTFSNDWGIFKCFPNFTCGKIPVDVKHNASVLITFSILGGIEF